jgi:hypothetical protein
MTEPDDGRLDRGQGSQGGGEEERFNLAILIDRRCRIIHSDVSVGGMTTPRRETLTTPVFTLRTLGFDEAILKS